MSGSTSGKRRLNHHSKSWEASDGLFLNEQNHLRYMGLDMNPGEGTDVFKCIVLLWLGGTLNSRRAASPLMWLVEGEERWEAPDHPKGFLPLN
ncbi:hypothetical protein TNCV_5018211 [Trichonephila clavipes]|nr:hypothetical protein TNCV_5018211 [Trichonephila clavipes]